MENDDTDAVIEARLSISIVKSGSTYEDAARSVVPRCPIEMIAARTNDHSANCVKSIGMEDRIKRGSSAWRPSSISKWTCTYLNLGTHS